MQFRRSVTEVPGRICCPCTRPIPLLMNNSIYKLKVTLLGVRPTVWRRLEVPAGLSLLELHRVIQAAFGWTDSHLHQFLHRGALYGAPDREFGMPMGSERGTRIEDLLERPKDR